MESAGPARVPRETGRGLRHYGHWRSHPEGAPLQTDGNSHAGGGSHLNWWSVVFGGRILVAQKAAERRCHLARGHRGGPLSVVGSGFPRHIPVGCNNSHGVIVGAEQAGGSGVFFFTGYTHFAGGSGPANVFGAQTSRRGAD